MIFHTKSLIRYTCRSVRQVVFDCVKRFDIHGIITHQQYWLVIGTEKKGEEYYCITLQNAGYDFSYQIAKEKRQIKVIFDCVKRFDIHGIITHQQYWLVIGIHHIFPKHLFVTPRPTRRGLIELNKRLRFLHYAIASVEMTKQCL